MISMEEDIEKQIMDKKDDYFKWLQGEMQSAIQIASSIAMTEELEKDGDSDAVGYTTKAVLKLYMTMSIADLLLQKIWEVSASVPKDEFEKIISVIRKCAINIMNSVEPEPDKEPHKPNVKEALEMLAKAKEVMKKK